MSLKPIMLLSFFFIASCAPEKVPNAENVANAEQDACVPNPPSPPEECSGRVPDLDGLVCRPETGPVVMDPKALGSAQPNWKLENRQPEDCGYGRTYGLDQFRDAPTMVVLLSAGCGFCQQQTVKLQEMKTELLAEGHAINFVIVNLASQSSVIENLTDICDFPIFQDTDTVDAWGLHDGVKDDFYFYDAEGTLTNFISARGDLEINLSTEEGYQNIKDALLELVNP